MNIKRLKKYFILLLSFFLIGCSKIESIDLDKDITNMGYENIIKIEKNNDSGLILKKLDDSEFTQDEMDNIYNYIDLKYIQDENYKTNISYNINYKEINIKISKR